MPEIADRTLYDRYLTANILCLQSITLERQLYQPFEEVNANTTNDNNNEKSTRSEQATIKITQKTPETISKSDSSTSSNPSHLKLKR